MLANFENLNKPEYFFRPSQIWQRIQRSTENNVINNFSSVILPWKAQIKVHPDDTIGRAIYMTGVYDLIVTEMLWRLIEQGEIAIDVGANIGYMTSIMAAKVTQTGKVYCYEPHPEIYQELLENITSWQESMGWHNIIPREIAISDKSGSNVLTIPDGFDKNRGLSKIETNNNVLTINESSLIQKSYLVSVSTLDKILDLNQSFQIGVLKIDIEGHEFEALNGAKQMISQQKIRDIIFEEHNSNPSLVTNFLQKYGYTIFKAVGGFWGPIICSPESQITGRDWEPPCYLATINPARVVQRTKAWGWHSLHNRIDLV
ncbi:FkbM family methyltransferase [Nostoc sp.]|uniref:FkbM family methyltransferase n=1 Tax=Nostoc sp. TaxID=1180 RepID=UPI002FF8A6B7